MTISAQRIMAAAEGSRPINTGAPPALTRRLWKMPFRSCWACLIICRASSIRCKNVIRYRETSTCREFHWVNTRPVPSAMVTGESRYKNAVASRPPNMA